MLKGSHVARRANLSCACCLSSQIAGASRAVATSLPRQQQESQRQAIQHVDQPYDALPTPQHRGMRTMFSQAGLYPSRQLQTAVNRIGALLERGEGDKAYKLMLSLRSSYSANATAADRPLGQIVTPHQHATWLRTLLLTSTSNPSTAVANAVRWLRSLEDSPDQLEHPTPQVLAIVLQGVTRALNRTRADADIVARRRIQAHLVRIIESYDSQPFMLQGALQALGPEASVVADSLHKESGASESALAAINAATASTSRPIDVPAAALQPVAQKPAQASAEAEPFDDSGSAADEESKVSQSESRLPAFETSSIPTFGMEYLRTIIVGALRDNAAKPMRDRQVALEKAVESIAVLEAGAAPGAVNLTQGNVQTFAAAWQQALDEMIQSDLDGFWGPIETAAQHARLTQSGLSELPRLLQPHEIASVAASRVMSALSDAKAMGMGARTTQVAADVGSAALLRLRIAMAVSEGCTAFESQQGDIKVSIKRGDIEENVKRAVRRHEVQQGVPRKWSAAVRNLFGSQCISFLLRAVADRAQMTGQAVPSLVSQQLATGNGRSDDFIAPRGRLQELLYDAEAAALGTDRHWLPMIVPPRPWLSIDNGGYLLHELQFSRNASPEMSSHLRRAERLGKLAPVFAALDVIGNTAWRVNEKLLRVTVQAWNDNVKIGHLVDRRTDFTDTGALRQILEDKEQQAELRAWRKAATEAERANMNNFAQRATLSYSIQVALSFAGQRFYLPYTLDFRGRAYPAPAYLSPTSSDFARALLLFDEAKPLGERGLYWLKIQVASMCGVDKVPFDERVAWVDEHLPDIEDSVDHPLDGQGWWRKQDKPWQCLANCIELVDALRSPDPLAFESRMPIQSDGTCNGLQHYAALGRDAPAAASVSLMPADRPGDVYSVVAREVSRRVDEDVAQLDREGPVVTPDGHSDEQQVRRERCIRAVQGKIKRKVVKQTVMTVTYGVTRIGATDQVEKQLAGLDLMPGETVAVRKAAAAYIAKHIFDSLGTIFKRATEIQDWLTWCTRIICRSSPLDHIDLQAPRSEPPPPLMTSMMWTTPLGLPVVQPYRKEAKRRSILDQLDNPDYSNQEEKIAPTPVDQSAQARGIPPNFVHSLDATHMMQTALASRHIGLTFAAVHDSYWTHAADIDQLGELLRNEFVKLYSRPLLADLHNEWLSRYGNHVVHQSRMYSTGMARDLVKYIGDMPKTAHIDGQPVRGYYWLKDLLPLPPPQGDFDIELVKESKYFFN